MREEWHEPDRRDGAPGNGPLLCQTGLGSAPAEAELLMAHLLATDRLRLYIDGDRPLTTTEISALSRI